MIKDIVTKCPKCWTTHIDEGEWRDKPHKTHLCLSCGETWRPSEEYTRGVFPSSPVAPRFGGCSLCGITEVCTCLDSE